MTTVTRIVPCSLPLPASKTGDVVSVEVRQQNEADVLDPPAEPAEAHLRPFAAVDQEAIVFI